MALIHLILSYVMAACPILVWWLICSKIKDYGILMISELVICHILLPMLMRTLFGGFWIIRGSFYGFSFGSFYGAGGIVVVYIVGVLILSFVKSGKHWNFSEQSIMLPSWKSKVGIIIYAVIVVLIALFVFPVSEHLFYFSLCLNTITRSRSFFHVLLITLLNAGKYYFLFDNSVKDKNAGLFWTIIWVLMYIMIDFGRNNAYWYFSGIGLKQLINLMYIITLTLYALGIQFPRPNNINKVMSDNKLSSLA